MNRHAIALREAGAFPALLDGLITLVDRAIGVVCVHDLSVLVKQRGIHLRMRVAGGIRLDNIDEGSCSVRCRRGFVGPIRFGSFGCRGYRSVVCKRSRSRSAIGLLASGCAFINRFLRSTRSGGQGAGPVAEPFAARSAGFRT